MRARAHVSSELRSSSSTLFTELLVGLMFVLVLLRPHPAAFPPMVSLYVGDLLLSTVVVFFGAVAVLGRSRQLLAIRADIFLGWTALAAMMLLLAMRGIVDTKLAIEAGKLFYYVFFCALLNRLTWIHDVSAEVVWRIFVVTFSVGAFVAVIQYFSVAYMYSVVTAIWGDDKLRSFVRVYGTFYNPNWFGWFAGAAGLVWLQLVIAPGQKSVRGFWVLLLISLMLLVMSGSRSAVIAFVAGAAVAILMQGFARGVSSLLKIGLILGVAFMAAAYWIDIESVFKRLTAIASLIEGNIGEVETASTRVETWFLSLDQIIAAPILGAGSQTGILAHNSYLTLAMYFGIPAATLALLVLACALYILVGSARYRTRVVPLVMQMAVMWMTGEFLLSTQVMLTFFLLCWLAAFSTPAQRHAIPLGLIRNPGM
jgi:hypothetical protein